MRGADIFKERISAVIFFRRHQNGFNEQVYVAVNHNHSLSQQQATLDVLQSNNKFRGMGFCRRT